MKKRSAITLLCLAGAFAVTTVAGENQDFQEAMEMIGGTAGKLKKEVEAKALADAAKHATAIQMLFKNVEDHFTRSKTDDAVKLTQAARASAKKLADAAKAGNADEAASSLKVLMTTCVECHKAHRETLPEGGYKIK